MFRGVVARWVMLLVMSLPVAVFGDVVSDFYANFRETPLDNALKVEVLDFKYPTTQSVRPDFYYQFVADQLADKNSREFPIYIITAKSLNGRAAADVFDTALLRGVVTSDFLLVFLKGGDARLDVPLQACADSLRVHVGAAVGPCGTVAEITSAMLADTSFLERVARYAISRLMKSLRAGLLHIDTSERSLVPHPVAPVGGSPATRPSRVVATKKRDRVIPSGAVSSGEGKTLLPFREHYLNLKRFFEENEIYFTCRYLDSRGEVKHLAGQDFEAEEKTVNVIYVSFAQLTKENLKKFKISRKKDGRFLEKYCHVICYDYCGKKEAFKACVSDLCEYFYASIKPIVGADIEDRYAESFLKNWKKFDVLVDSSAGGDGRPQKRQVKMNCAGL